MLLFLPIFVVITLILSAILTPPVMSFLLQFEWFDYPFSRVFDRVAMLVILILVVLFRKHLSLAVFKEAITQGSWKYRFSEAVLGLSMSFIPVVPVVLFLVYSGDLVWGKAAGMVLVFKLLKALSAGIVISLIEESFFRVLLFRRLKESFSLWIAVILCCLLYASAHFISPVKTFTYGPAFQWDAGFVYLYDVCRRLLQPGLVPAFIGLVTVGAILCFVIHRSGRFYLCVGLHAGWVLALKGTKYVTDLADHIVVPAGAGARYFLVAQPEAWAAMALTALAAWWVCRSSGNEVYA